MDTKPSASAKDYHEGPTAARKFEGLLKKVLVTPRKEVHPQSGEEKTQRKKGEERLAS